MRLLASLTVLCLLGTPGRAESGDAAARVDLARRHFQSGSAYFEEGRFDEAAREFRESYRLAPRVDLLYNVAQCYLKKGDSARALEFFQRYLDGSPSARDRSAIHATIRKLRKEVGSVRVVGAPDGGEVLVNGYPLGKAPLSGPVAATVGSARFEVRPADGTASRFVDVTVRADAEVVAEIPPPLAPKVVTVEKMVEAPHWYRSRAGWAVAGVGAALLIGGAVSLGLVPVERDSAGSAATEAEWRSARDTANTLKWVGVGLLVGGAAAVGASVLVFALGKRSDAPKVSLSVSPAGVGVVAQGAW